MFVVACVIERFKISLLESTVSTPVLSITVKSAASIFVWLSIRSKALPALVINPANWFACATFKMVSPFKVALLAFVKSFAVISPLTSTKEIRSAVPKEMLAVDIASYCAIVSVDVIEPAVASSTLRFMTSLKLILLKSSVVF